MDITSLVCNRCGAPLRVPEHISYTTCAYCGTSLQIRRDGGAVYSEMFGELRAIQVQTALLVLDSEWNTTKQELTSLIAATHAELLAVQNADKRGLSGWSLLAQQGKLDKRYKLLRQQLKTAELDYQAKRQHLLET